MIEDMLFVRSTPLLLKHEPCAGLHTTTTTASTGRRGRSVSLYGGPLATFMVSALRPLACAAQANPSGYLQGLSLFFVSHCVRRDLGSMSSTGVDKPVHVKCRYPNRYHYKQGGEDKSITRQDVPANLVPWEEKFPSYAPPVFTAPFVLKAVWADPDLGDFQPMFNSLDGKVNRKSHEKTYLVSASNEPLNIRGRTGLMGRGVLGKWGPNHAADPVVTRWKRSETGEKVTMEGKPIIQIVVIQRRDNKQWALPGGMVDPGEVVSETVRREFMEEAMDATSASKEQQEKMEAKVKGFFDKGHKMYSGYVDDPRNTDNAWMETTAFLFHDETGDEIGQFNLKAGDDAQALQWMDVDATVDLYASHKDIVKKATEELDAHW